MSPLTITVRDADTGPVLRVTGDLDFDTAPQLRQAVDALALAPGDLLVLDLGGLEFCDSSGISALITAHNRTSAAEAAMALAAVPDNITRVLGIVGLDQVFARHDPAPPNAP
ncbi:MULTISPECIES: STAS domain-containing protein [unclassified Streptomyces]|uniref:STAS domain-containing protein n=1 Tax=unclassified Streptomyces TaxID=2593676 RepID=UPI002E3152A6|nr:MULTISPECIES: STAS domain-containing protein [unclassified Streptomyces]